MVRLPSSLILFFFAFKNNTLWETMRIGLCTAKPEPRYRWWRRWWFCRWFSSDALTPPSISSCPHGCRRRFRGRLGSPDPSTPSTHTRLRNGNWRGSSVQAAALHHTWSTRALWSGHPRQPEESGFKIPRFSYLFCEFISRALYFHSILLISY